MLLSELKADTLKLLKPPKKLSVSEWADKYRVLSSVNSAEPGNWNTSRAEYQREIMNAFSDSKCEKIVIKSAAQVGKSEILNNCIGYAMYNDPGPIMMVQPTEELAKGYSKERLTPMIQASPVLKELVADPKTRDSSNTILSKVFKGGFLTLVGANAPSGLRSRPIRYLFLDEVDTFPNSAGTEGDPIKLAIKRTQTYFNKKIVMCSTPTIKNASKIDREYNTGTQEEWCVKCKKCGTYHYIDFRSIGFDYDKEEIAGATHYSIKKVYWVCPKCESEYSELETKALPKKWIARNTKSKKVRSFKINAFLSPWQNWENIVLNFLQSKESNNELQVFFNTVLGESWEIKDRSGKPEQMLERREKYKAEVPEGALVLTCGIDTQDNRLEYEVVGWGRNEESWGIMRGVIPGRPDSESVWHELDMVLEREFEHESGKKISISASFMDSGGHFTQDVYDNCNRRYGKRLFAIKGRAGQGYPYVEQSKGKQLLFLIGVDSGKAIITSNIEIDKPGTRYCHFPLDDRNFVRGYNIEYFQSLLSERMVINTKRGRNTIAWEKKEGVRANEMFDCRNYALAAFRFFRFDLNRAERRLLGTEIQIAERKPRKKNIISRGIQI